MKNNHSVPGISVRSNTRFSPQIARRLRLAVFIMACISTFTFIILAKAQTQDSAEVKQVQKKDTADSDTSVNDTGKSQNLILNALPDSLLVDTALYDEKMSVMANGDSSGLWPVKTAYPNRGAILPFKRVIAFYGNLYSKRMGILGELPPKQMLDKLQEEVKKWEMADSTIEVLPALHYIAVTAQVSPGNGGKYRLRMPSHQIDAILSIADQIDAIVFLDIQVGLSTLQEEIPQLERYLKKPNVHLGIDPEFSMKGGQLPGKAVGVCDASDINYAAEYLGKLVKQYDLPPKILVVHRYTRGMVTNYRQIKKIPEVQLVMHMDGWGNTTRKLDSYKEYIYKEPVQFTGFKLFYKNDTKKSNSRLLTPEELLQLRPRPLYIQYQ